MRIFMMGVCLLSCVIASGCATKDDTSQPHTPSIEEAKSDVDGHEQHMTVRLTTNAIQKLGLHVEDAQRQAWVSRIRIPADVDFNRDKLAHISPLVGGQLIDVSAAVGDAVASGAALATMRSVELGQARADLSQAKSELAAAKKNRDRQQKLRTEGINSERSLSDASLVYEQAVANEEAARSRIRVFGLQGGSGPDMTLASPISGTVVQRHATRGENVSPDDTLFIIADLSEVWIQGQVIEQNIPNIQEGMEASLQLTAFGEREWTGTVDYVDRVLDPTSGTMRIRVVLQNPDGDLRPGMRGTLLVTSTSVQAQSVFVPIDAVQRLRNQSVVFVPHEDGLRFTATPVELGRRDDHRVEILSGIQAGDRIVTQGAFTLTSELVRDELGEGD